MEELKRRYNQLLLAYNRLYFIIDELHKFSQSHPNQYMSIGEENIFCMQRDALIQRFEFCFDLTWKYLKLILQERYGIQLASPRKVFTECYTQGFLTEAETEFLVELVDARNQTSHIYDETMANKVSKKIIDSQNILKDLIKKIDCH